MGVDVGKFDGSMYGIRNAASNWKRDWQEHVTKVGKRSWELSSKNLFRHEEHQDSGMTHDDDFLATGPTDRLADLKNKICRGVSIKALNRRLHCGKRGVVCQHDPRHVDVVVNDLGHQHGNSLQTPTVHDMTDEEPDQRIQVTSCKMCVPQSRPCRHVQSSSIKAVSTNVKRRASGI